jgi:hypothetical protein
MAAPNARELQNLYRLGEGGVVVIDRAQFYRTYGRYAKGALALSRGNRLTKGTLGESGTIQYCDESSRH